MPSVHRQKNNIVHAIRGCAKSAAPDVLYVARVDVYFSAMSSFRQILLTTSSTFGMMFVARICRWNIPRRICQVANRSRFQTSQLQLRGLNLFTGHRPLQKL